MKQTQHIAQDTVNTGPRILAVTDLQQRYSLQAVEGKRNLEGFGEKVLYKTQKLRKCFGFGGKEWIQRLASNCSSLFQRDCGGYYITGFNSVLSDNLFSPCLPC